MAKNTKNTKKETTTTTTNTPNVKELTTKIRELYSALGEDDKAIQKRVDEALKSLREPAMTRLNAAMIKAANALLENEAFADDLALLHGSSFGVVVELDKDGNTKVVARTSKTKRSKRSGSKTTGKRPVLVMPSGDKFNTWSELVRSFDVDPAGDSARRVYERLHADDEAKYPMPSEVDQDAK